jgi:hypothetical protein
VKGDKAMIYARLLIILGIIIVAVTPCSADEISAEKSDNEILALVLGHYNPGIRKIDSEGGGFWIVGPETLFAIGYSIFLPNFLPHGCSGPVVDNVEEEVDRSKMLERRKKQLKKDLKRKDSRASELKERLQNDLKRKGYQANELIDLFFEKNVQSRPLSLKSSPESGYIIDYEKSHAKYFEEGGGGWEKLYRDNPLARGSLYVSMPAYDAESGLIILFLMEFYGRHYGEGNIIFFQYEKNEIREISRTNMWVS